jgi:uncharacterized protein (TIGR03437 family)
VPATVGNYSGTVTVQGTNVNMRIPYLFSVGNGVAFNIPEILGSSFGIAGHHLGTWVLGVTDAAGVAVENSPVSFTVSPRNALTLASVAGQPACTIGAGTATCPTNKFGYAWLDITLGASVADSAVTISAAGARLGPYTVSAIAQPTISAGGVIPAANVDAGTPIAPGSYIAIYGTGLSEYLDVASGTTLPMSLDGVTVSFDVPSAKLSLPGRIVFVSPNQVDVQVPWELKGQSSVQMKVTLYEGLFGNVVTVPLSDYSPSFFHTTADALDVRYAVINATNPAKRGEIVQLFVNGLGPVSNQPASGEPAGVPLSETPAKAQITVGGVTADVGFSGLAPGFPGLYQVNFTMPSNVTPGSAVPISLSIGGKTAKQATIPVQ